MRYRTLESMRLRLLGKDPSTPCRHITTTSNKRAAVAVEEYRPQNIAARAVFLQHQKEKEHGCTIPSVHQQQAFRDKPHHPPRSKSSAVSESSEHHHSLRPEQHLSVQQQQTCPVGDKTDRLAPCPVTSIPGSQDGSAPGAKKKGLSYPSAPPPP